MNCVSLHAAWLSVIELLHICIIIDSSYGNIHFSLHSNNNFKTTLVSGPSAETPENIDYEFAQQELMNAQMGDDPIQEAIEAIEKQHEEDKQGRYLGPSLPLTKKKKLIGK